MKILVAEDNDDSAEMLARILRRFSGHRVDLARDGGEAVRMYDEARRAGGGYDLLVVDAAMPVTDGFSVAEHVHESGTNTPVVMVTGNGESLTRAHARRVHIRRVIEKPYDPNELLRCVDELLNAALTRVEP